MAAHDEPLVARSETDRWFERFDDLVLADRERVEQGLPRASVLPDCVRAGSFRSVSELVEEITAYLAHRNENPKPYRWKADGAKTLAKIHRAREALAEASAVI